METSRFHGQRSLPLPLVTQSPWVWDSAVRLRKSRRVAKSATLRYRWFRPLPSSRIQRQFRALDQRNLPRTVDAGFYQPPMLLGGLTRIGEAERPDPAQRDRQHSLERLVVGHDQSVLARGLQQKT